MNIKMVKFDEYLCWCGYFNKVEIQLYWFIRNMKLLNGFMILFGVYGFDRFFVKLYNVYEILKDVKYKNKFVY